MHAAYKSENGTDIYTIQRQWLATEHGISKHHTTLTTSDI
jgi:hypothetical protein